MNVSDALYKALSFEELPKLIPIEGSVLLFGCFANITLPEFVPPAVAPAKNLRFDVIFASTFPWKVKSPRTFGRSDFVNVDFAVFNEVLSQILVPLVSNEIVSPLVDVTAPLDDPLINNCKLPWILPASTASRTRKPAPVP